MKVLIIGIVASGKTTLARRLEEYGIKHYGIDSIVHDDYNNRKRSIEEQIKIVNDINKNNNNWIIEGALRKNLDDLLNIADLIIYIDISLSIRKKEYYGNLLNKI